MFISIYLTLIFKVLGAKALLNQMDELGLEQMRANVVHLKKQQNIFWAVYFVIGL